MHGRVTRRFGNSSGSARLLLLGDTPLADQKKADKGEKADKAEKGQKADKAEKPEKAAKAGKTEDAEKEDSGILVDTAKAIGRTAGKVASMVGASHAEGNRTPKTARPGKLVKKDKHRLPRREKKAKLKAAGNRAA